MVMKNLIKRHEIADFSIVELGTVESTMTYAKDLHDKQAVFTKNQLTARGKGGRKWEVKEGNFYLSISLIPQNKKLNELPQLSFVSAIALRDSFIEVAKKVKVNLNIKCKWPNDILINDKKISGILLESELDIQKDKLKRLIIGIGVNVIFSPKCNLLYKCTDLKEEGVDINATDLMKIFFNHFDKYYNEWIDYGFTGIRNEWLKNAYNLNKEIIVKNIKGEESDRGIFLDLDNDGNIKLKHKNGNVIKIYSGDVFGIQS